MSCLTLRSHELQQARPHVASLSPRVCSNSCPLSPWCHPNISCSLPLLFLPSTFQAPGSFPMNWFYHQVANVLEPQLSHQSFQWIPRVDFCRTDRFDLPAVQRTLKGFLQHHSSKAIILWGSTFFHVQISHPYMTTGKPITSTIWTFVGKLMSLLYNMLSTFVTAFLPRNNHLLISWLQSLAAVSFEAQENKVCHSFHCFLIYLPWSDGTGCQDLWFLNV